MIMHSKRRCAHVLAVVLGVTLVGAGESLADHVIQDHLIVQGGACIGATCAPNESLVGFHTLTLKERSGWIYLYFNNFSALPGRSTNSWRLVANDGNVGFFAIEDLTRRGQVFRIDAGAPANSLRVVPNGNVGIGTATPARNLHVRAGIRPGVRLERDGSSTLTPQAWDIVNNTSFTVQDVTGDRQPFTIAPGAPNDSLKIEANGNITMWQPTGEKLLRVFGHAGATMRLESFPSSGEVSVIGDSVGIGANRDNSTANPIYSGKTTAYMFTNASATDSFVNFGTTPTANTQAIERMRIDKNGNVGMRTASPVTLLQVGAGATAIANSWSDTVAGVAVNSNVNRSKLQIEGTGSADLAMVDTTAVANDKAMLLRTDGGVTRFLSVTDVFGVATDNIVVMRHADGNVGIGTATPAQRLHTTGGVRFAGVAGCGAGIVSNASGDLSCLASSRQFKNVAGDLPSNVALANVMALRPQTGSYKDTPDVPEHWLIAEEVAAVDPALIGLNDGKPYVVKMQNIVADMVAVMQQQQRRIDELERLLHRQ